MTWSPLGRLVARPSPLLRWAKPIGLKGLVLLCPSYVLRDQCLPRGEHLGSGACGLQALTDGPVVALEGRKRE